MNLSDQCLRCPDAALVRSALDAEETDHGFANHFLLAERLFDPFLELVEG